MKVQHINPKMRRGNNDGTRSAGARRRTRTLQAKRAVKRAARHQSASTMVAR